jgi:hypothetical protein
MRASTYFAWDGSFGDAMELIIVDTANWTDEQWDAIDGCLDSERVLLAKKFSEETR